MTKILILIMALPLGILRGQVVQYEPKSDIEFPYFDFISMNCPCVTKNMKEEVLHENQLEEYRSAQQTADSLTKFVAPCYEYKARFICGVYHYTYTPKLRKLSSLDHHPKVLDRKVIFKKPLHRDSTICPAWQIEIVKIRSLELMSRFYSSFTICDDEVK